MDAKKVPNTQLDAAYAKYRERYAAELGMPPPDAAPAGVGALVLDTIESSRLGEIRRVAGKFFRGNEGAAVEAVAAGDARASRSVPAVANPGHVLGWLKAIHDNAARDQLTRTKARRKYEAKAARETAILDDYHTVGVTSSGLGGGRADASALGPILKEAFPEATAEPEDLKYAVEDRDDSTNDRGEANELRGDRGLGFSTRDASRQEVATLRTPEDEAIATQEAELLIAALSVEPETAKTIEAVAMGESAMEIAAALGKSVTTVERARRKARDLAQQWAPPGLARRAAAARDSNVAADSSAGRAHIANALKPAWRLRAGVDGPLGLAPPKGPVLANFLMHSAWHLGGGQGLGASTCLSDAELADVTGKERPSAQARVLNHLGITHRRRPDGTVLVHRAHFDRLLDAVTSARGAAKDAEPNWSDSPRGPPGGKGKAAETDNNAA